MADIAISAVVNKAVDIVGDVIVEESSRLHWLPEDIRWLERQMRHIQAYMDDAEAKKITNPKVGTLIKDIRELAHDVEDIFDTFLPKIESHRASGLLRRTINTLSYSRICSKFSREIEKIKRRVQGIDEDRKNFGVGDIAVGGDQCNVDRRTTTLHFDDPIIVGFDQDIQELKTKLKRDHFVSIVGMPGLGKTTLGKKIFKSIKDGFDCSASVSVSQQVNIKGLLQDIATQVGLEKEKQDKNLELNLYSFLERKMYLLFLDDVWHTEAWDSLRECFPIDSNSRMIVTSRDTGVGRYIGGENSLHHLQPLDYPTSWELFSKLIKLSGELDHSELKKIGKQIVEKCGGVPLAIVVTVGMLRRRGMNEFGWNKVLESIGQDASDKCSQILSLSYMDLPTALKPCFLYFGNFPEDYEFSASELIRLWMAEKFVQGVGAKEPEDVGEDYISKLDARNLIQVVKRGYDGRVKKFRVHDLLHGLCVNMGRDIDFLETVDHLESSSVMNVRRLAANDKVSCKLPKLRALFHFKCEEKIQRKHLKNMLGNFTLLGVLILETSLVYLDLPTEIGSLSRLNFLKLGAKMSIGMPSSIQRLRDLQTLEVVECLYIKLPIGVWTMRKLRHLLLESYRSLGYHNCDYYLKVFLPNIQTLAVNIESYELNLFKFNNLRKLTFLGMKQETMEVLCGLEPISKKLETLYCLSDVGCTMSRRVTLGQYDMLMKLNITGVFLEMSEPLELPSSLVKLTLRRTLMSDDPMKMVKKLPKLRILELSHDSYCGTKMDLWGDDGFPQLEVFKIECLRYLELIEGEEEMGMPKLRKVIIRRCDKLRSIPQRFRQLRMMN